MIFGNGQNHQRAHSPSLSHLIIYDKRNLLPLSFSLSLTSSHSHLHSLSLPRSISPLTLTLLPLLLSITVFSFCPLPCGQSQTEHISQLTNLSTSHLLVTWAFISATKSIYDEDVFYFLAQTSLHLFSSPFYKLFSPFGT